MRPAAIIAMVCLTLPSTMSVAAPVQESLAASLDPNAAARFAGLALKCLHDEYPSHISVDDGPRFRRPSAPRVDAGILRLLRLAFRRTWPLAAGTPPAPAAGCAFRSPGARGAGAQLHGGKHRRRTRYLQHARPRLLRAPLRARVAAAIVCGAARVAGPQAQQWSVCSEPLETEAAARFKRLAAQTALSDPYR